MIGKNDFIKAIGEPDAGFTEAVDSALAVIRAREQRKKPRRYHMILPVAAAAAIFVIFMGATLRGGLAPRQNPDEVFSQPKMTPLASVLPMNTAAAEELETPTPQPTLTAEQPYVTEEPLFEDVPEAYTQPPVEYEYLDENIAMSALDMFSGSLPALYPGYTSGIRSIESINAYGVHQVCAAQWIENDSLEMAVEWVCLRAPEFLPEDFADAINNTQFYAVSIDVPGDPQRIDAFINSSPAWLKTMYDSAVFRVSDAFGEVADYMLNGVTDFMLTGINVYLDETCIPRYCELYFDSQPCAYLIYRIENYDAGNYGFELLLDEYAFYSFNDIFGDPDVIVTAEPTAEPEEVQHASLGPTPINISINIRDHITGFHDSDSINKVFNAYAPLLQALNPAYDGYDVSYETVSLNGVEMDCHALRMDGYNVAAWIAMDAPDANDQPFYTLNIPITLPMNEIDNAMYAGDALVTAVYEESRTLAYEYAAETKRDQKDMLLSGIKLYLDEYITPIYCEMYLGGSLQYRALWKMGDDVADILETGVNDVRFDYAFPAIAEPEPESDPLSSILSGIGGLLGFGDNDLGIIGGADGPTRIIVSSANEQLVLPEYYCLFTGLLGAELTDLWPGSAITGTFNGTTTSRGAEYPCEYWVFADDNEFTPAWITWGEVVDGTIWDGEYECPTLNVFMPDDPDQIDAFMRQTNDWMFDMYFKSRDYVCELVEDDHGIYNGWKLAGMKLTLDENEQVKLCEFFFGDTKKVYFQWIRRDSDGTFGLTNQYFDENGEYFNEYFAAPGIFTMPDDEDMFAYAYDQSIDTLYPDNNGLYMQGNDNHVKAFVKYGAADSVPAYTLTRGKLWDTDMYAKGDDFISVNAIMPEDPERVHAFMTGCPTWLAELYQSQMDEEPFLLANVIVTFTPQGEVYACEMIFKDDTSTHYNRWLRTDDGTFEIVESGGSELAD
ncbi:MAG: hypothetical protein IJC56_09370 [Clostridia bacterium]|nr:hypothetical protein [Clostridia bacterium]